MRQKPRLQRFVRSENTLQRQSAGNFFPGAEWAKTSSQWSGRL